MRIATRTRSVVSVAETDQRSRLWLIVIAAVLWGTVGITTQSLYRLTPTNPLSVGFFRLAIAAPVLSLGCWAVLGRHSLRIARRDLARVALIGAMLALYQVCYFAAIARVGVTIATLVTLCLAPVLVALLSVVFLNERPTRRVLVALICALAGITAMVGFGGSSAHVSADLVGILLACGSAFGYALVALLGRSLARRYHPLQINAIAFATGALVLLPLALMTGFVVSYPAQGWLLLAYLGLVPSALAYALFLSGMRTTPATIASIVTLLEPLTATVLAALLFGERLGPLGLIGAGLLLAAMVVLAVQRNTTP
ncbi:MAG TPA: EamA family transporter [Ktedonobacterales bacterium]